MSDVNRPAKKTVKQKLTDELVRYAVISAYLFVCFGALILYKWAILQSQGVTYAPYGLAAIKALILGKFLLLGHAVGIGNSHDRRRLIHIIVRKSLLLAVFLVILSFIEEVVAGLLHGRTILASVAEVAGGTLPQVLTTSLIILLILIPYVAFNEINEALGQGRLIRMLGEHRVGHPAHGVAD